MSQSTASATNNNLAYTESDLFIKINQTVAQKIDSIATQRQVKMEILINEILEQYIAHQHLPAPQTGATFLLSLAGMFSAETSDTSENVHAMVTDFILSNHGEKSA